MVVSLFLFSLSGLYSQTYLSVDVDEAVYRILDIAEMKGIIHNLSQVRPYSRAQIIEYLNEISSHRNRLSNLELSVLDSAINKYKTPDRERNIYNILTEGKVHYNNDEEDLFPIDAGLCFDFETRGDINSGIIHSTNFFTFFIEGDIKDNFSYNMDFSLGVNNVNVDAFSPFAYTNIATDSFYISKSSGLEGAGHVDGDKDGTSFSMMSRPELAASFFDGLLQLNFARIRRDMGHGYGNLTVSHTARPYTGIDLEVRPLEWFNVYWSMGALNNWFYGKDWGNSWIEQKMLSTQKIEFIPLPWLYASLTTSAMWAKRMELAYMIPLLPPIFGQLLTGDNDNSSVQMDLAFTIPIGLKLYAGVYLDEMISVDNIFADPIMPYAVQAGIKYVIPKLPFTVASFQYTKLEPYVYDHKLLPMYFADDGDLFILSWTNNGENLGYHLPPNSDEFLFRIETLPYKNLRFLLQYQYIRHGHGNVEDGEMPGYIANISFVRNSGFKKDFLNDGIYEKIHIATIEASYEFEEIPLWFSLDYSFNYATNFENIEGNTMTRNILGMKVHIFP